MLLAILVVGLLGGAFGFALFLPFGFLIAFVAAITGGAIGIVLAGSWLAFVQHRKTLGRPHP